MFIGAVEKERLFASFSKGSFIVIIIIIIIVIVRPHVNNQKRNLDAAIIHRCLEASGCFDFTRQHLTDFTIPQYRVFVRHGLCVDTGCWRFPIFPRPSESRFDQSVLRRSTSTFLNFSPVGAAHKTFLVIFSRIGFSLYDTQN